MPPSRLFDLVCIVHSATDILGRAASIQGRQTAEALRRPLPSSWSTASPEPPIRRSSERDADSSAPVHTERAPSGSSTVEETPTSSTIPLASAPQPLAATELPPKLARLERQENLTEEERISESITSKIEEVPRVELYGERRGSGAESLSTSTAKTESVRETVAPILDASLSTSKPSSSPILDKEASPPLPLMSSDSVNATPFAGAADPLLPASPLLSDLTEPAVKLKASKVPSSQIGRLFHYGSLAVGLGAGAASEFLRRSTSGSNAGEQQGSVMMSEANVSRLVDKLSQMRGAALKLGQFMSIQDSHILPEQIDRILRQVQNNAHYMPNWQMEQVMTTELGADWKSYFSSFEPIPFASASIGQVHRATVASTSQAVAVKIQFPNVAQSIASDLRNLSLLLHASRLLPRGMYLESSLKVMREELEDECNYLREAQAAKRFREVLTGDDRFKVMGVVDELTTKKVLVMEMMQGESVARATKLDQSTRNKIGNTILTLCMRELFHFRFMQTDPNWSNFLYNSATRQVELVDFGASREYSKEFINDWYLLLSAAIAGDRDACIKHSLKLGYLTGEEKDVMVDAHVKSLVLLGIPFATSTSQPFSFGSSLQPITSAIREQIPIMLKHRLTPPPRETYSLNRKLSGALLLCGKLGAEVDCQRVWKRETVGYEASVSHSNLKWDACKS